MMMVVRRDRDTGCEKGYLHSSLDGSVQGGGQSRSFRAHGGPQVMQGQSCSHT